MYFIDSRGKRTDVVELAEGYIISDGDFSRFVPEEEFISWIERKYINLICEDPDKEESTELCDCPYCEGVRVGVEMVLSDIEDDDECDCEVCQYEQIHSDIVDELKHLKEDMIAYRQCGDYEEYEKIVNAYVRLYHLAFEDSEL